MLTKILGVICLVMLFATGWLWQSKTSLESSLVNAQEDIQNLEHTIDTLNLYRENAKKLDNKEDELVRKKDNSLKGIDEALQSVKEDIERIDNTQQNEGSLSNVKRNEEASLDSGLNPDVKLMLDKVCERIRGSACPSP